GSARRDRSCERHTAVEDGAEPHTKDDMHRRRRLPAVGCANGEGGTRAARAGDAPVAWPGEAVVSRGGDDEGVEPESAGDGSRRRAVLEGCERLRHPDERHLRGIECGAVAVRVDRVLETGDKLVGAPEDGPATARVALPAGDADRHDGRTA